MDDFLVEPDWLEARLGDSGILVIDCSWNIPEAGRDMQAEFEAGHIPGARFFDLDKASDPASPHPNMLPEPAVFAAELSRLGITPETRVVIYDSGYVSARVWWMFREFGHPQAAILNGGWKRWKAEQRAVETGPAANVAPSHYPARPAAGSVVGWQAVKEALDTGSAQIVDARTRERFTGELDSGYPGVAGGHMPGATNLPWSRMVPQQGDFTFISPEAASALFAEAGIDIDKPIIATCGSGVTAAVLGFQLARLGRPWSLYDGSWHEWGQRDDLPRRTAGKSA